MDKISTCITFALSLHACADGNTLDRDDVTLPDVTKASFVARVDNPYFPLPVGARWVYEGQTDEGHERIEVTVLAETRVVNGVTATVVKDIGYLDGQVIEETNDWFAQDSDGNVWYLGEDTCEVENGVCVDHHGAWEWGVDGALPGLIMPATPVVDGQPYFQEFYRGEAEDVGEVVALGVAIAVPAGSYTDCIRTRDTSILEPDTVEFKTYCRGIGPVHEQESEDAEIELLSVTGL